MNIYLIKNGQNAGPYTEPEIMNRVKAGSYTLDDLAWFEGCAGPVPLAQVFAKTPPPITPIVTPAPAPQVHPAGEYSAGELIQMADLQRKFFTLAVAWLVYCFIPIPESFQPLDRIIELVALGYWFRFNWKLSRLLRKNPWVWTVLTIIPFVNLIAWGRILWLAAQTLRANGIPCGFMGADQAALNRLGKSV